MSFNRGNRGNQGRPDYNQSQRKPPPQPERREYGRIYVALDTETTGTEPDSGEIIEVAAVRFRLERGGNVRVLDKWQTFVRPHNPIPYKISHLTGIRQADVEHAPNFEQIRERLEKFIGNFPLVGHSIDADIAFLARQSFKVNNTSIDTYELATLLIPNSTNFSLVAVAGFLDVLPEGEAHRAMADTMMAVNVFAKFVERIEDLPFEILREVNKLADGIGDWSLRPIFKDAYEAQNRQQAAGGSFSNLGMALRQQLAEKTGGHTDDELDFMFILPQEKLPPLQPKPELAHVLEQLPQSSPHSEGISTAITHAFSENKHLLAEAPVNEGTRDEGFLHSAVHASLQSGQNIVIALNSDAQRERLVNKVIPELERVLAAIQTGEETSGSSRRERRRRATVAPFTSTVVKNQNSYLCLRRWEIFRKVDGLTPEELKLLIKVLIWLPNTSTGDCAELRIPNFDRLWSRINTQKPLCLASHCVFNQRGQCFYFRARDRAVGSNVVLADQSLILADVVGLAGTLPEFDHLIIDDAHHLEDETSKQFGTTVTPFTLFDFLDWISRPITWRPQGGHNGFVHEISRRFYDKNTPQAARQIIDTMSERVANQVAMCRSVAYTLLQNLAAVLTQINQESGVGDGRVRLDNKFRAGSHWSGIVGDWENFKREWEELYYLLRDLRDEMHGVKLQLVKTDAMMLDLNYFVNQSNFYINKLSSAFEGGDQNNVYWLANHPRTQLVAVFSAPLQVAHGLARSLFAKKKSVALLSSTLTIDGDFNFVRNRLGLNHENTTEARLPAEHDYSSSVLLCLPTDMPEPSQTGYQKAIDQQLIELAKSSKGRMIALFSSNSALRLSYKSIQRQLEHANILVLGLGLDGTRRSVLERWRNTPRSVLLSTLGHWEQGDLLKAEDGDTAGLINMLVFTKLPFEPPSDPLFAARTEGRVFNDAFTDYSLPRTILRFKQSFERLLASLTPKGVVVMLDGRLTSKSYGPTFLNSLPALNTCRDSLAQISHQIDAWLS
jgi:Rad3-related DNA helicase/DNA polymerase III epsilon subunit-like protein